MTGAVAGAVAGAAWEEAGALWDREWDKHKRKPWMGLKCGKKIIH